MPLTACPQQFGEMMQTELGDKLKRVRAAQARLNRTNGAQRAASVSLLTCGLSMKCHSRGDKVITALLFGNTNTKIPTSSWRSPPTQPNTPPPNRTHALVCHAVSTADINISFGLYKW